MIICEINKIAVHSSLLDCIDMQCINAKCQHHGCCHTEVQLLQKDIDRIKTILPKVLPLLPPKNAEFIAGGNFYHPGYDTMRTSMEGKEFESCIFFQKNKCTLASLDAQPTQCNSFPIILQDGILQLSNKDLPCLQTGSTPAYKLLKNKIISLTSKEFYAELERILSTPEKLKMFKFLR